MRRNALELSPLKLPLVGLTAALWVHSAGPAQAHGAKIEVLPQAVEIIAAFETGEPMDNAQVAVYAPDRLDTPWQTGQTDSEGRFSFAPDTDLADGLWEVTVRKAGHGQTKSFSLGGDVDSRTIATATQASTTQSAVQKWSSIVAVIWGFIGTALFFSRKAHKGNDRSKSTDRSAVELAVGPPVEPALEAVLTVDNRATMAAGFGNDGKATAEESR
ncbi:MAG: carboxypeptidase-like regulatory domain-containing protein [Cyanobacteria bacterium P01_F01_bin.53]